MKKRPRQGAEKSKERLRTARIPATHKVIASLGAAFLLVCSVYLNLGCSIACGGMPGETEYRQVAQKMSGANTMAVAEHSRLSVDKQIDLHLYVKNCRSDPRIEPLLALNGVSKIAAIVHRIKTEPRLGQKVDLALDLSKIDSECKCVGLV